MSGFWIPLLAGAATGVLSAWGIGGGTLLLLVMTLLLGVEPRTAQGINLLYFLPTAGMGLLYHRKNGLLDRELLRRTVPWGLLAAAGGALLALLSLRAVLLLGTHTAALLPYPNFSAAGLAAVGDFARHGEVFFAVPLLLCEVGRCAALASVLLRAFPGAKRLPATAKPDS